MTTSDRDFASAGSPTVPNAAPSGPEIIARRLSEDATVRTKNGWLYILGGVAITLTMALVVALVINNLVWLTLGSSLLGYVGWAVLLLAVSVLIVVVRLRHPLPGGPINYVAVGAELKQMHHEIRHYTPGLKAEWITDIEPIDQALIGLRMLIAGIRQFTGADTQLRQRFFNRCAHLLAKLASVGEGVDVKWLMESKQEPIAVVEHVINYLEKHDWIGANSTHTKVWLSSQAKQVLPYMGIPIGRPNEV